MTTKDRPLQISHAIAVATTLYLLFAYSLAFEVARAASASPPQDNVARPQIKSVWEGAYNDAQAARGEEAYSQECGSCHGQTLAGGEAAPALVGSDFTKEWTGMTVGDLFERISMTMPKDSPGHLSRQQYADIIAHILKANDFPAGKNELGRDGTALKRILIDNKSAGK